MDIVVYALTLGLMYGLTATGFSLILGTSRIYDCCFGMYYLLGGYFYYIFYPVLGVLPAGFLSILVVAIMAWLIHKFILYHFRASPNVVMVVSCSLAIGIGEAIILLFGTEFKYIPPLWEGTVTIFEASLPYQRILAGVVSLLALSSLWFYLNRTKQGLGIRALIQQLDAAQLAGIDPKRVQLTVACIGSGLAALSAIMVVPVFCLSPHIWLDAMLLAFAGVVVGGLGKVWGAFLAMLVVAFAETLVSFAVSEGGFFRQAAYVSVMVIVILIRPHGFFGKKEEA